MPKQRIAEIEVGLTADDKKFKKAMKDGKAGMKGVEKQAGTLSKAMSVLKSGWLAIAGAVYAGVRAFQASISATMQQESATMRLTSALKNQGFFTKAAEEELNAYAAALQRTTGFSDEQIKSGQAMLVSFKLNVDQIKQMTPHLLNLAAFTEKTTGTMSQLEDVAKQVGRALEGQPGSLTEMGISLSKLQKEQLLTAEGQEKLNVLMDVFQQNAGGMAEAAGETIAGGFRSMKGSFSDLLAEMGKSFEAGGGFAMVRDALDSMAKSLKVVRDAQAEVDKQSEKRFAIDKIRTQLIQEGVNWTDAREMAERQYAEQAFRAFTLERQRTEYEEKAQATKQKAIDQYDEYTKKLKAKTDATEEDTKALEANAKMMEIAANKARRLANEISHLMSKSKGPAGKFSQDFFDKYGGDESMIDPTINSSGGDS